MPAVRFITGSRKCAFIIDREQEKEWQSMFGLPAEKRREAKCGAFSLMLPDDMPVSGASGRYFEEGSKMQSIFFHASRRHARERSERAIP